MGAMKDEAIKVMEERKASGKCPTCGTVMFKILGGKVPAAAPAVVPAPVAPSTETPSAS